MDRRAFLSVIPAFLAIPAASFAQGHHHHHHGQKPPVGAKPAGKHAALIRASAECVEKGQACLAHCFELIAAGDKSVVECAKLVTELNAACQALQTLAAGNSKNLYLFGSAVKQICNACERECRKHADHHVQCRECADACVKCRDEIGKLAL